MDVGDQVGLGDGDALQGVGLEILVQGGLKAGDYVLITRLPEVGPGVLVSMP